jgi:hypothetical protein
MSSMFEQLAAAMGSGGLQQQDLQQWNQSAGSAPADQFGRAVFDAIRQVPQREYYQHTQPGVGGTDPFGALAPPQRSDVIGTLLSMIMNRGVSQQQVMQGAGLSTLDPRQMSPDQMAALAQWAQQNHPQAFGYTAAQYQQQPNILASLLGNEVLMKAVATLGASYLASRARKG